MSVATVLPPENGQPSADEYSPGTAPRDRRPREIRAVTVAIGRIPKRRLELLRDEAGDMSDLPGRPRTRAECKDGPRPCPFIGCQHHLYLDVLENGNIKLNFPDVQPDQLERLPETCALDVAARGGVRLEDVGAVMNVVRERVRQIEERALQKLEKKRSGLRDYRGHAHDFDFAEPIAPRLPIVSRAPQQGVPEGTSTRDDLRVATAADPSGAPLCDSPSAEDLPPAEFVISPTKEVPMGGKWSAEQRAKFAATAAAKRADRESGKRKPRAAAEPNAVTMDVADLAVADLLEAHRIVQTIGVELARAIAARIERAGSGS